MLLDAQTLPDNETLEADICIVGAGAAGIAIAREFLNTDVRVIVLESGGLKFEHRTQFLYRGEVKGRAFTPLEHTRRRQFGGSTATWFGRCHPLDDSDLEERDWLPFSGWAVSANELRPYYERANQIFELGDTQYTPVHKINESPLEFKQFHFSPPTQFGEAYQSELKQSHNVRVILHANATHIQLNESGTSASSVQYMTLQKKRFATNARYIVLALGGLETPRLLLASHNIHTDGIGNQHGLVGRFFMDHVSFFDAIATHIPAQVPTDLVKLDYSTQQKNLGKALAVGLSEPYRNENKLLNACGFFVKRHAYKTDDLFFSREFQDVIQLSDLAAHKAPPSLGMVKHALRAARNLPKFLPVFLKRLQPKRHFYYGLQIQLECAPNPESRLTLSDQTDPLGMPRILLDWKLSRQDLESYRRFRMDLFNVLAKAGFQLRPIQHDLDEEGWPVSAVSSKHHMGTTRMHNDPKQGVVDRHCRVHGVENLFIASSSVFPTSGMANPTLTIGALALRIADTLKRNFQDR